MSLTSLQKTVYNRGNPITVTAPTTSELIEMVDSKVADQDSEITVLVLVAIVALIPGYITVHYIGLAGYIGLLLVYGGIHLLPYEWAHPIRVLTLRKTWKIVEKSLQSELRTKTPSRVRR